MYLKGPVTWYSLVGIYRGFSWVDEQSVAVFSTRSEAEHELDWARATWGHKYQEFEIREYTVAEGEGPRP